MSQEIHSRVLGPFTGYHGGAIFRLANGQAWQQRRYKYKYKYAYRPHVHIYKYDGKYLMEVEVMDEPVEVTPVNIAVEGTIVSDFSGFNGKSIFEFSNGQIWRQAEYKYSYHYAYRPTGIVVNGVNGNELSVEGMSDTVRVDRIR